MTTTTIILKNELGPDLGPRFNMEELFNNIPKNTSEVIMDFEGVEFVGRSIAQEYINQKHFASFNVIEKNVPEDAKKLFEIILKQNNVE